MRKTMSYRLLNHGLRLALGFAMCVGAARAQQTPVGITEAELYCSGVVTDKPAPNDIYVVSGENSDYKTTFQPGNYAYINQGEDHGVKVGDKFEVIRATSDPMNLKWFKYQPMLTRAMGTTYADVGQLRVVRVEAKTSTVEVTLACDLIQRGDIVRPFQPRPAPALHTIAFDPLAPPSGNKTAMIVTTKNFGMVAGVGSIVYVNLGSEQGVQAGNYFRIFRYQGTHFDSIYQVRDTAYKVYGFGSTPVAYNWDNLPRQVLGEGIVLRTGPNSSTVLLTTSRQEIYVGDYVEVE